LASGGGWLDQGLGGARPEGATDMTVVRIGEPERERRPSLLRRRVTPGMAALVIGAIIVLRLWVVETAIVDGRSMEASLQTGDRVLVLKPLGPERFDVVVLKEPGEGGTAIKRVVGLPGETVSMVPRILVIGERELEMGSQLYIDGEPCEEPYATSMLPALLPPVKVPEGSYFVMGDNRDASTDSRSYGPVPRRRIQGVAVAVLYPFSRVRGIERGSEVGAGATAVRSE